MTHTSRFLIALPLIAGLLHGRCAGSNNNDPRMFSYDVRHYALALDIDVFKNTFTGNVGVRGTAVQPLTELVLSAWNATLTIDSVRMRRDTLPFVHTNNHLVITLPSAVQSGDTFAVTVFYHGFSAFSGAYDSGGISIGVVNNTYGRVVTSSQPFFARAWWPCKDLPNDKATVSLKITTPASIIVAANGTMTKLDRRLITTHSYWETQYPTATYLVAIAAAQYRLMKVKYTGLAGRYMPMTHYVYVEDYQKALVDFAKTDTILGFLAKTFGEYPFIEEKYSLVEVSGNATMENQTMTTIEDKLITGDGSCELTIVHETAHQWFGNLITPTDWRHTWLSEGFAAYTEALYLEEMRGRSAYETHIGRMMAPPNGTYAGSVIGRSDTSFWDAFSPRVYYKGALVLHMLRAMVGDSQFFTIMRNYVGNPRYRYGNASTEDFINECELVHGQPLRWFFDQWVYAWTDSIDRPELAFRWSSQRAGKEHRVSLELRQTTAKHHLYQLPLTVDITTAASRHKFEIVDSIATQSFTFTVPSKPTNLEIDKEKKIFRELKRLKGR